MVNSRHSDINRSYLNNETIFHAEVQLEYLASTDSLTDAANFLFPPETLFQFEECSKRAFLSILNENVDEFNEIILEKLIQQLEDPSLEINDNVDDMVRTYESVDLIKEDDATLAPPPQEMVEFINMQYEGGVPRHELRLAKFSLCRIMRNFSVKNGLVKNARCIVTKLRPNAVKVRHHNWSCSLILKLLY